MLARRSPPSPFPSSSPRLALAAACGALVAVASSAQAIDIEGVLPASLDQPRIYVAIAKDAKSPPLTAKAGKNTLAGLLEEALGEKPKNRKANDAESAGVFAVQAFLDTGASGIMLSKPTAEGLGITPITTADGKPVTFYDVGVGGMESFAVTAPFFLRTAEFGGSIEGDVLAQYAPPTGPMRLKVREASGVMDELTGGLDVVGMPIMVGKVMVMDARPLAKYEKIKTSLVMPGDKSIPAVDVSVALTYVDYARFTQLEPANAPRVSLSANPMIGRDPFNPADKTPPVTITHNGKSAALAMLLDTGAASSMISTAKAKELGIAVDASGKLTNVPAKDQFTLPIGGIGGTKNVNGFYVDVLQLPATKGQPVRYLRAPVLVLDISVEDEKTGQTFTLDGVLGMNYLVASADLNGTDLGEMRDGPFTHIVIDHAKKTLGMKLKK